MERSDKDKKITRLRIYTVIAYVITVITLVFCFSDVCAQTRNNFINYFKGSTGQKAVTTSVIANAKPVAVVEETLEDTTESAIGKVVIKTWQLNVRQEPNGTVMGTVSMDEEYEYYEVSGNWLRICYQDQEGYIHGRYCDKYNLEDCLVEAANIPQPEPIVASATTTSVQSETVPQPEVTELPESEMPPAEVQTQPEPESQPGQQSDISQLSNAQLCRAVLAGYITDDMTDFEKVTVINDYLCNRMEYDLNYYTTREALLYGKGRCQGYANAFKSLCTEAGIPTDYVSGYAFNNYTARHAWNRVYIEGQYYCVDVTTNDGNGYNAILLIPEEKFNQCVEVLEYNPPNRDKVE